MIYLAIMMILGFALFVVLTLLYVREHRQLTNLIINENLILIKKGYKDQKSRDDQFMNKTLDELYRTHKELAKTKGELSDVHAELCKYKFPPSK